MQHPTSILDVKNNTRVTIYILGTVYEFDKKLDNLYTDAPNTDAPNTNATNIYEGEVTFDGIRYFADGKGTLITGLNHCTIYTGMFSKGHFIQGCKKGPLYEDRGSFKNSLLDGQHCTRLQNCQKIIGAFIAGDPVQCIVYENNIMKYSNYSELHGNKYGNILTCTHTNGKVEYSSCFWHNGREVVADGCSMQTGTSCITQTGVTKTSSMQTGTSCI